jgi:hypothetical protein
MKSWSMKSWYPRVALVATLAVALASGACLIVRSQDIAVQWSIDGSDSAALCDTYGIDHFTVYLDGPESVDSGRLDCRGAWADLFLALEEGSYIATVSAFDQAGQLLATRTQQRMVNGDVPPPVTLEVDFTAADFGGGAGGARIDVLWNINGTIDGSPSGKSWDRCAEVGASTVLITVDGQAQSHDCDAASNMSTTLEGLTDGRSYQLKVKLQDASGKDLTTEASGRVRAGSASNAGQFVGDFYYDSFYEPAGTGTQGTFRFEVSFDGARCSAQSPPVELLYALVTRDDGSALTATAQVCDGSGSCVNADGSTQLACSEGALSLSTLTWGRYRLIVEGSGGGSCWRSEQQILVGAGSENPLVELDLATVSCP